MSDIGAMVAELVASGADPEVAARVVAAAFVAGVSAHIPRNSTGIPVDEVAEKRRAYDRERKRKSTGIPPDSTGIPRNSENASLSKESKKEEVKEEATSGRSTGNRGKRLPDDWRPSPQDHAVAEQLLGIDRTTLEMAKFRDHWKQQPGSKGVKLDWDAAWRNWARRAAEYHGGRNGSAQVRPNSSITESLRRELAELEGPESSDCEVLPGTVLRISDRSVR